MRPKAVQLCCVLFFFLIPNLSCSLVWNEKHLLVLSACMWWNGEGEGDEKWRRL